MAKITEVMFRSGAGIKTDIEGGLFLSVNGMAEADISEDAEDQLLALLQTRRDARGAVVGDDDTFRELGSTSGCVVGETSHGYVEALPPGSKIESASERAEAFHGTPDEAFRALDAAAAKLTDDFKRDGLLAIMKQHQDDNLE